MITGAITAHLLRKRVALEISDPWDFGTECGTGAFYGLISDADDKSVLVVLEDSIEYAKRVYTRAMCDVRHEGVSTVDLWQRVFIPVNVLLLTASADRFADITREDLKIAMAAIGSLRPA
jgi:hypothetical protein